MTRHTAIRSYGLMTTYGNAGTTQALFSDLAKRAQHDLNYPNNQGWYIQETKIHSIEDESTGGIKSATGYLTVVFAHDGVIGGANIPVFMDNPNPLP